MIFFGLTERFQDSLFLMSFVFGWQPLLDVLHHNKTSTKTLPDSLPSSTWKMLESYNQYDQELYAFAQQEFQLRFDQMCLILLERYGSRVQTRRRLPLPQDDMVALLEAHYRQRFIQRQVGESPFSGQTRFTFDSPAPSAAGWQRREVSPIHGPFRWTGPGTTASLDLPRPDNTDLTLQVAVIAASRPELLDCLRVLIYQEPLPCRRLDGQGDEIIFEVDVPARLAGQEPFLRLSFETQSTAPLRIADPARADPRHVGIAVKWIEWKNANKEEKI
jgi:hypothetical protein